MFCHRIFYDILKLVAGFDKLAVDPEASPDVGVVLAGNVRSQG
jgi:hypothetical protein